MVQYSAVKKEQQKKGSIMSLSYIPLFANNQQTFFKYKSSFEESDISEIFLPCDFLIWKAHRNP